MYFRKKLAKSLNFKVILAAKSYYYVNFLYVLKRLLLKKKRFAQHN